MTTLMNTTWTLSTGDTIQFVQNGPSANAGMANISGPSGNFQASWAEAALGAPNWITFVIQFGSIGPGTATPPYGTAALNPGTGMPVTNVCIWGTYAAGPTIVAYSTNFFGAPPNHNHVVMPLMMTQA